MSRGKYLSLEEARKMGKVDQFAKEQPSRGNWALWERLFAAMAPEVKKPAKDGQTSKKVPSASYSGTRTRRGT